jgi:hypothetical protein
MTRMSALTLRLQRRIERDYPDPGSAPAVARLVADASETERTQAAIVLYARQDWDRLTHALVLAQQDWRDVLVGAELADEDCDRCSTSSLVRRRRISRGRSAARAVPVLFVAVSSEHDGQQRSRDSGPPIVSHSRDDSAGTHTRNTLICRRQRADLPMSADPEPSGCLPAGRRVR